ncbi:restriction endonuclease subunit S [Campylobacter jejuni]|nr:restriction endonuclease subunit S [Campylobacter jejuni]
MNKIEKLLNELCPNGVEFKSLGEVGIFFNGLSGKKKDDFKNGNAKYITYLNVFNNIATDLKKAEFVQVSHDEKQNMLKKGDVLFTLSSESLEECGMSSVVVDNVLESIYLNSFCFGFRFNDNSLMLPDFSKYLFRDERIRTQIYKTANGVTRFNISRTKFEKIQIPIPPIEIQEEIVKILDAFTELEAELEARRRQYEYYRNKLLSFEYLKTNGGGYKLKMLGEVCEIYDKLRKPVAKDKRVKGDYPYYGANGIQDYVNNYLFEGEYLLIGEDGSVINKDNSPVLHFVNGKFWVNNHAHIIQSKNHNLRFIYYALQCCNIFDLVKGTPPKLNQENLKIIQIPIPPLEVQEKIVSILDKFHALTTDLQSGIPAEIEARKKQYEYYRNQLLTFKEAI